MNMIDVYAIKNIEDSRNLYDAAPSDARFIIENSMFPNINFSKDDKIILSKIGLPKWSAPHLSFGDYDEEIFPELSYWLKKENRHINLYCEQYYVFGTDEDDNPIVVSADGVISVIHETERVYMNKSLSILYFTLIEVQSVVNSLVDNSVCKFDDIFVDYKHEFLPLIKKLKEYDVQCLHADSFWGKYLI